MNDEADTIARPARRRIAIGAIPELARPVGLFGTLRQAEVGGSACYGAVVTFSVSRGA